MNIKIQNLNQLKMIISLALSGEISPTYIFSGEIKLSFELKEKIELFDGKNTFKMVMPQAKNPRFIDFEDQNEDVVFSYDCQNASIEVFHENRDLNTKYVLLDDDGFSPLSQSTANGTSEHDKAELTFLKIANVDLTNGYWSEDYEIEKAKNTEKHLAVFGYKA